MRTRPLLCNARHRAMITPVSPVRTRLIHISPSYWLVYRYSRMITVHWNSYPMLQKTVNLI